MNRFKYKLITNRHGTEMKKSLLTSLYFLCALHYITADYHLQSVVWHLCFSLLALHAWLAALEPLSRRDLGLF